MALHVARSYHELMTEAREAETNGELEKAAKIYERALKQEPHEEQAYNRLMIIYRKLAMYEEELKTIKKGIHSFEDLYQKKAEKLIGKSAAIARLSTALAKSLGQKGKKAENVYYP